MKNNETGFVLASATQTRTEYPTDPPIDTTTMQQSSPAPASSQAWRVLVLSIGYLLLYVGAFQAAALLDTGEMIASLWYLPAGLTVFGLLVFGWTGVALDAMGNFLTLLLLATEQGASLSADRVFSTSISALIHSLGYVVVMLPSRRWVAATGLSLVQLIQPTWAGRFLIAITLSDTLATGISLIEAYITSSSDFGSWRSIGLAWWVGNFIGMITITPLLLVLLLPRLNNYLQRGCWRPPQPPPANTRILADTLLILLLALLLLFGIPRGLDLDQHLPFATLLLLMPLVWITLRHGLRGAVLGTVTLSSGLVMWTAFLNPDGHALEYQLVMIATAVTGLFLGGAVEAHHQAQTTLQVYATQLEQQVAARTEELQLAYRALVLKERHLYTLIDAAPVGIAELDSYGYCRYLNPVGCVLTACDKQTAAGRHIFEFVHPSDRDYLEFIWQLNATHEGVNWLEFRLQNTGFWISAHWINLIKAGQPFLGSIIIFVDNTEQRRKDEQLWTQAHYDALTGLPNRNLFWERLAQNLHRAKRNSQNVAALWIDLDGFKAINDTHGHATGDELLQQVALRLNSRMRDSDTIARMGGDEFAVILPDLPEIGAARQVAVDLTLLLAEPFTLKYGVGHISASIGVALYPLHTEEAEALVKYADIAMYAAKNAGKNQVAVWQSNLDRALLNKKNAIP